MPNIRMLAKAVLKIFCSQSCSNTKCLCLKKESNATESSKVNQFINTLVRNYMPNIRMLAKAVLKIFRSQGCPYTKCLSPKKGSNSTENLRICSKVNQFINTLVCNYMPDIRMLVKAVLKIFCSQGCSYTKCLCLKKGEQRNRKFTE